MWSKEQCGDGNCWKCMRVSSGWGTGDLTYAAQEAVGGGVLLGPQRAGVLIDEL